MKIGLLTPYLSDQCGIAIYSHNLIQHNLDKKVKMVVIGNEKSDRADYQLNFKSFSLKKKLKEIIKKEKIDLIHVQHNFGYFSKFFNYNLLQIFSLKIPMVVTLHEVEYSNKGIKNKILNFIENKIVKKVTKVIVHTEKAQQFLEQKYKKKNIRCIYHGLELMSMGKRMDKNILFFGFITPSKGLEYLIQAMTYLPDYHLTIVGSIPPEINGDYKNKLNYEIKKNKLKNVHLTIGWTPQEEKWNYYKKADVIVLPHVWAPYQSGILHNALSCGKPVVVSKVGSLYEMVEKFKFGEIVEPKNPKALAYGIKKVFENYTFYTNGIKKYRNLANWTTVMNEHLKLYQKLI